MSFISNIYSFNKTGNRQIFALRLISVCSTKQFICITLDIVLKQLYRM